MERRQAFLEAYDVMLDIAMNSIGFLLLNISQTRSRGSYPQDDTKGHEQKHPPKASSFPQ